MNIRCSLPVPRYPKTSITTVFTVLSYELTPTVNLDPVLSPMDMHHYNHVIPSGASIAGSSGLRP